jgi:hypothetical protein
LTTVIEPAQRRSHAFLLPDRVPAAGTPAMHQPNPRSVPERGAIPRRAVLAALAAGSIGGSIVGAAPLAAAAKVTDEIDQDKRKARYQESEHVKTFYRVNRYP